MDCYFTDLMLHPMAAVVVCFTSLPASNALLTEELSLMSTRLTFTNTAT